MGLGHIDYYMLKPWRSPDELFHRTLSEFIHEWSQAGSYGAQEIAVVCEKLSPRAHELQTLLARNGVPHVFHLRDSEQGRRRYARASGQARLAPFRHAGQCPQGEK